MTRQMGNNEFRADQHARLTEPHIAPITTYVESVGTEHRWLPYVAPMHAGVKARMLTLLRDPGPATLKLTGSGMLSFENDDQTASNQMGLMEIAGIDASEVTPWNAYPWYINRAPKDAELREATTSLLGFLDLLPLLAVVLLQGREARVAWTLALEARPALRRRHLIVIETYHASNQALQSPLPGERERRIQHRISAWRTAGDFLRSPAV
jgi:hypothetical protein